MSQVEIYGIPKSSYVRSARWALAEKGIEHVLLPPDGAALDSPAYLARHPFGKIPALAHGDVQLYEVAAICQYADEAFDGPSLQPTEVVERAQMRKWISIVSHYFDPAIVRNYTFVYRFADGEPDRAKIDATLPDIEKYTKVLDETLGGRDYLVADHITIAEFIIAPMMQVLGKFPEGEEILSRRKNITRAVKAWTSRPAYAVANTIPDWAKPPAG